MVRILLILFLFSIGVSSPCLATTEEQEEVQLQKIYGEDLNKVPFFIKYSYNKQFGVDWGDTSYPARRSYLENYEEQTAEEKKQLAIEAREAAQEVKEEKIEARQEARALKEKQRAEEQEAREEAKEEQEREKAFAEAEKVQQKELAGMIAVEQIHGASAMPGIAPIPKGSYNQPSQSSGQDSSGDSSSY